MSARSKLCREGRHDFEPATGLCRRSGCEAFHHAGQATMFGRDLDPVAVREAKARIARTGQGEMFSNPDRLEYAETQGESVGSDVKGGTANRFLQVIAAGFAGGRAFTAKELAAEAGSSESAARAGIKALRRRGYVHAFGRELTNTGRKGAERFVGTIEAEERAQSARDHAAEAEGAAILERQIAAQEALADFLGSRAKPGAGAIYRPVIRRQKTSGHKLPKLTARRIRGAGYRVCNTNPRALSAGLRAELVESLISYVWGPAAIVPRAQQERIERAVDAAAAGDLNRPDADLKREAYRLLEMVGHYRRNPKKKRRARKGAR